MESKIPDYTDKGRAKDLVKRFWTEECPQIKEYNKYPYHMKIIRWSVSVAVCVITLAVVYLLFHFFLPESPMTMKIILTGVAAIFATGIIFIGLIFYMQQLVYIHWTHIKETKFGELTTHDKYLSIFQNNPEQARAYNWILCKIADYKITKITFSQDSDLYWKEKLMICREHQSTTPPTVDQFENKYRQHFGYQKTVPSFDNIIEGLFSKIAEPSLSIGTHSVDVGSTVTSTTKSAESSV